MISAMKFAFIWCLLIVLYTIIFCHKISCHCIIFTCFYLDMPYTYLWTAEGKGYSCVLGFSILGSIFKEIWIHIWIIVTISSQTNFLCRIQWSYLEYSRNIPFSSIWIDNRMFLTVNLLHNLLFGYHGNQYSYSLNRKWANMENHFPTYLPGLKWAWMINNFKTSSINIPL